MKHILLAVMSITLLIPTNVLASDQPNHDDYSLALTVGIGFPPAEDLGLDTNVQNPIPYTTIIQTVITEIDPRVRITNLWFELTNAHHVYTRAQAPLPQALPSEDVSVIVVIFPGAHEEMTANVIIELEITATGERFRRSTERELTDQEQKPETLLDNIFVPDIDQRKVPSTKPPEVEVAPKRRPTTEQIDV